jgi:hypothetical protein
MLFRSNCGSWVYLRVREDEAAGLAPPTVKTIMARVRARNQAWLIRRREHLRRIFGHRSAAADLVNANGHPARSVPI